MAKKRKAVRTRVNTGQKRSTTTSRLDELYIEQLERRLTWWKRKAKKLEMKLSSAVHHAREAHECSGLLCYITHIKPIDTPFVTLAPRVRASTVTHSWVHETLRPYTEWHRMLDRISWWWRKPYGWWLSFWTWMNTPLNKGDRQ